MFYLSGEIKEKQLRRRIGENKKGFADTVGFFPEISCLLHI